MLDLGHKVQRRQNLVAAIVGHTNVGKTTLMRTLLWSHKLGRVKNQRGTTEHIERSSFYYTYGGERYSVHYIDTPGMESPLYFSRAIEQMQFDQETFQKDRGLSKSQIMRAVNDGQVTKVFPIEVNCIKQSIYADLCLYVVDCRQPLLAKYLTEMELLQSLLKPMIVVLNYADRDVAAYRNWVSYLIAHGFHSYVELDPTKNSTYERGRLLGLMSVVGPEYQTLLEGLGDQDTQHRRKRLEQSAWHIAEALIKLSAYRLRAEDIKRNQRYRNGDNDQQLQILQKQLSEDIKPALVQAISKVIRTYGFQEKQIHLMLEDVNPQVNQLFNMSFVDIQSLTKESQSSALAGAAAGLGVDAAVGGISLGAAALLGAITGSAYGMREHAQRLWRQIRNGKDICVSKESLSSFITNAEALIIQLEQRGHGAQKQLSIDLNAPATSQNILYKSTDKSLNSERQSYTSIINHMALSSARIHPDWYHADLSRDSETLQTTNALSDTIYNRLDDEISRLDETEKP